MSGYPSGSDESVSAAESASSSGGTRPKRLQVVQPTSRSKSKSPTLERFPASPASARKLSKTPSTVIARSRKGSAAGSASPARLRPRSRKQSDQAVQRSLLPKSSQALVKDKEKPVPSTTTRPIRNPLVTLLNVFKVFISLLLSLLQVVLSPIWSIITVVLCFAVFLAFLYYSLPSLLPSFLHPFSALSIPYHYPTTLYCNTIGLGCKPSRKTPTVAALARTVADQATQAHDIFQSLSAMGDPASVGLHHTEIWELAVSVAATSNLPSREPLSLALKDLGDYTRDVKDRLITINSIGVNSFSWTVHEFKRIEQTINNIHLKKGGYTSKDIAKQLDSLFDRLARNLDNLLSEIEQTIPTADRASLLGGDVLVQFATEHSLLLEQKENTPLWRSLLDRNTFKGRQLSRDLDLAEISIDNLKAARTHLEDARRFLLQYRDNVAYFKSGVVGFHLADHNLRPEDEVASLSSIMQDFQYAVDSAKKGGGSPTILRDSRERRIDAAI